MGETQKPDKKKKKVVKWCRILDGIRGNKTKKEKVGRSGVRQGEGESHEDM